MTDTDAYSAKARNATLLVVMLTNFVPPFAISSLNIAVPRIGAEFGMSAIHLTWIVLSFTLTTVVLTIPCGRLADLRGKEFILKLGILLVCLSAIGNALVMNIELFFSMRVLQGVGGAMIFATNMSILVDAYPANRRGWALGVSVTTVYTGLACGPVIGGFITQHLGWRFIFALIAILSAAALLSAVFRLPKFARPVAQGKMNPISSVLFIASLGLIAYGLTTLAQNIASYIIFACGIVCVIFFVKHELRTQAPIIDLRLFRNNTIFTFSNIAALFNYAAIFAISYLMSIYLQLVLGWGADMSGLILICQPIVQTIVSPIAGRLSDLRSPSLIASLGMMITAVGLFMLAFVGSHTSAAYIIAALVVCGLGCGIFASPNTNVIMGSVDKKDYNTAAAVQSTSRTFGQVTSMAFITIIMNILIGNRAIEEASASEIVKDTNVSFAIFALICVVGIVFSLKRRKDE